MAVWESSTKMVNDFNLPEKSEHSSLPIYPLTSWSKTIRLQSILGIFVSPCASKWMWYIKPSKSCYYILPS